MSDTAREVKFIPGETTPMSPHLQVWKFSVTMAASISHRITGVGNAVGMLLLVAWVGSAAISEAAFDAVRGFLASPVGLVLLFLFTLSVMFHLLNGLRYLFADGGKGLGKYESRKTAWAAYVGGVILAALVFFAGFALNGGAQ